MQKILLFVTLAFSLVLEACVSTPVDGHMAVYNRSSSPVQTVVDGRDVGPVITPNGTENFRISVDVPTGSQGSINDPNSQVVPVGVAIRNLSTRKLSQLVNCSAGAKIVTSVTYTIDGTAPYQYENVNCQYTY